MEYDSNLNLYYLNGITNMVGDPDVNNPAVFNDIYTPG